MDLFIGLVALFVFYYYFLNFSNLLFIKKFFCYYFFLSFFLPFLLSHVADGILVLQAGVRPEPLRWES